MIPYSDVINDEGNGEGDAEFINLFLSFLL